jgi:hypothetical protein
VYHDYLSKQSQKKINNYFIKLNTSVSAAKFAMITKKMAFFAWLKAEFSKSEI